MRSKPSTNCLICIDRNLFAFLIKMFNRKETKILQSLYFKLSHGIINSVAYRVYLHLKKKKKIIERSETYRLVLFVGLVHSF